jgi:hypothetical protein
MRGLVGDLLAAEKKGDAKAFEATKKKVLATWASIAAEYRAIAPTPQIRQRFDAELEQLLGNAHHHKG